MEEDGDDKDDSKRRTRNLSEKKRRDQFNLLVNELSTMVSTNNRKMDKSTVLKATIAFLKQHNETTVRSRVHDVQEHWKPAFLSNEEFTYLILEALEGFVMVFSVSGRIHYVSEGIASLLGQNPADIINMSIFDLTYEDDLPNLYNVLQNPTHMLESIQVSGKETEVSFQCHLRRGTLDFKDETTYELIQFHGNFRTNVESNEDGLSYPQDTDSRLFVCTGRLHTPQLIRDVSLVDPNRSEFTSRHSLEWKFLFLDHRASPIIGYLPFEVLGTSGYDYYHFDDLEKVATCHEALMQKGELTSCYYRFLTKGQQWIWLQTRFYITYHQWNSKPQFVVCTHRVVSMSDMAKNMKEEDIGELGEEGSQALPQETPADEAMANVSPYMSEASETFTPNFATLTQPASVQSASVGSASNTAATAGTSTPPWPRSWPRSRPALQVAGTDTSMSGESRDSQRAGREMTLKVPEITLMPQHRMGVQYLEPAPYVAAVTIGTPLLSLPVDITSDQTQIQRKHEELQQMIVRQQEELRLVKEQLLLARLGILQPIDQFLDPEDVQPSIIGGPPQIMFEDSPLQLEDNGYQLMVPNAVQQQVQQQGQQQGQLPGQEPGPNPQQQPPHNPAEHPRMPQ